MRIIYLLLCALSLTTAKVQPRTGANDVFDGVEGVIYDIPEYEDPEVSLFQLIAKGIMPVVVKDLSDLPKKDDKPHYQTDDIKKGLDTVITQLQEAKNKLENGNNAVYLDIDKSVLSLETLKHHLYLDLHSTVASSIPSATPDIIIKGSSDKAPADKYSVIKSSIKKYVSSDYPVNRYFSFDIPSERSLSSDKFHHSSFDDTALMSYLSSKTPVKQSSYFYSKKQPFDSLSSKDEKLSSSSAQPLPSSISPPLSSSTAQPISSASEDPFYSDDTSSSEPIFAKSQNLPASSEQPLTFESLDHFYSDDTSASESLYTKNQHLASSSEQPSTLKSSTEHPGVIDKSVYEFKLQGSSMPPVEMIPYEKKMKIDVVDDVSPAKDDQASDQGDKTLIRKKWSLKISTAGSSKK